MCSKLSIRACQKFVTSSGPRAHLETWHSFAAIARRLPHNSSSQLAASGDRNGKKSDFRLRETLRLIRRRRELSSIGGNSRRARRPALSARPVVATCAPNFRPMIPAESSGFFFSTTHRHDSPTSQIQRRRTHPRHRPGRHITARADDGVDERSLARSAPWRPASCTTGAVRGRNSGSKAKPAATPRRSSAGPPIAMPTRCSLKSSRPAAPATPATRAASSRTFTPDGTPLEITEEKLFDPEKTYALQMNLFPSSQSLAEFRELAQRGNLIPVHTELIADAETPVSAFQKIDDGGYSFLFESVEKSDQAGRYSFVGTQPRVIFESRGRTIRITRRRRGARIRDRARSAARTRSADAALSLRPLARARPTRASPAARSAISATTWCAFSSRASARRRRTNSACRRASSSSPRRCSSSITAPAACASSPMPSSRRRRRRRLRRAPPRRSSALVAKLAQPTQPAARSSSIAQPEPLTPARQHHARGIHADGPRRAGIHPRRRHLPVRPVAALRDRLHRRPAHALPRAALRESVALHVLPEVRRALRARRQLAGSPRARRSNGRIEIRPIAGTRRRGARRSRGRRATPQTCSPIPRNAPSTSCSSISRATTSAASREFGSVKVTDFMTIEKYSHVMHIVSNVDGTLRAGPHRLRRDARHLSRRHRQRLARKCAPCRSSTSSRRANAASTPARSATSASTATATPASPCAPSCSRTAKPTCKPAPASSPIPRPKANTRNA